MKITTNSKDKNYTLNPTPKNPPTKKTPSIAILKIGICVAKTQDFFNISLTILS